jgi:hypothetical protein
MLHVQVLQNINMYQEFTLCNSVVPCLPCLPAGRRQAGLCNFLKEPMQRFHKEVTEGLIRYSYRRMRTERKGEIFEQVGFCRIENR